jgi:hypothetical protein
MDDDKLRQRLRIILDLEVADPVDWALVQQLSADLLGQLSESSEYEPPHLVHHYLDDADIRERDSKYGEAQRAEIRRFVETGDREVVESSPMPPWPCLLVFALLVALTVWVVFRR